MLMAAVKNTECEEAHILIDFVYWEDGA